MRPGAFQSYGDCGESPHVNWSTRICREKKDIL
jgi:hypothetical protein